MTEIQSSSFRWRGELGRWVRMREHRRVRGLARRLRHSLFPFGKSKDNVLLQNAWVACHRADLGPWQCQQGVVSMGPSPTALLGPVAVLVATRCSLCMRVRPQVPPLHEDASRAGLGPASRPHFPPNTSRKTKHVWHTGLGLRHLNFRATHSNESFTLSFKIFSGT